MTTIYERNSHRQELFCPNNLRIIFRNISFPDNIENRILKDIAETETGLTRLNDAINPTGRYAEYLFLPL